MSVCAEIPLLDAVTPYTDTIADRSDLQVFGGVYTIALGDLSTIIDSYERLVIVTNSALYDKFTNFRPDGSRRDADVLMLSSDTQSLNEERMRMAGLIGGDLEISLFGLRSVVDLRRQQQRNNPTTGWVSDRYLGQDGQIYKAVRPFAAPIDADSLEPWTLVIPRPGDLHGNPFMMPVPNPALTIANYLTRSISGIRPKDESKVQQSAETIFAAEPNLQEWLRDGPGQSQFELAQLINSLRRYPLSAFGPLGLRILSFGELADHAYLMYPDDPRIARLRAIGSAAARGRVLHKLEEQEKLVTNFQKYIEKYMGGIVGTA